MAVDRISKLNIDERTMFTGIYGKSSLGESFIEKNLVRYHLWQELYLYLHEKGYTTIFYNKAYNFFSYQEKDLETFLCKVTPNSQSTSPTPAPTTSSGGNRSRHSRCRGPLGAVRQRRGNEAQTQAGQSEQNSSESSSDRPVVEANTNPDTGLASHWPDIITGGSKQEGFFYQVKELQDNRVFDWIYNFTVKRPNEKLAVVFTTPEKTSLGDNQDRDREITKFNGKYLGHERINMPLRLLCLYSAETTSALYEMFSKERGFFFDTVFKNLIFPEVSNEGAMNFTDSYLFYVANPSMDEIGNVLNRRRIMEGVQNVFNMPFDVITRNLWQDFPLRDISGKKIADSDGKTKQIRSVDEMMNLPKEIFEITLNKLTNESGRDKLNRLLGMEEIRTKLDAYIKEFHNFREGKSKKFLPHIALTGNPGTGKTTIARLIGEILREEGLLSIGHFTETSPKDLIGQYIGETRVKTSRVCQESRGGILFIDEAYGLCPDNNGESHGADYGKEAVEALLTYMLSEDRNLVVVFAGYPKEIEYMLKNGNPGLSRRVPYVWNIEDYKPEVLFQIAMMGLKDRETTEEFRQALQMILSYKYAMRSSKTWGNAGSAEEIVQKICTNYTELGKSGPMDVDCIPDEYMRHIKDISEDEKQEIMSELDQLIGLGSVKKSLRDLMEKIDFQRDQMRQAGLSAPSLENMNFIFSGNPGTGKTTVARLLGKILHGIGVLDSADMIEADVAKINHGDPAHNIIEYCDKAIGKVLFIDEAYSLINQGNTIALDALTKALTDNKYKGKMAVVLAGYSADMDRLLEGNKGMTSRFPNQIHFEDYTNEELWKVLLLKVSHSKPVTLTITEECHPYAVFHFSRINREKFSNAREAENLLGALKLNMSQRVKREGGDIFTIMPQDFDTYGKIDPTLVKIDDGSEKASPMEKLDRLCGIDNIKQTFQKFLKDFRLAKSNPQSAGFHPHMAFMGNPGTGKTTVARIFGEILREEHLLANGNFIEAKAEDFIGQYVGESAQKAKAKCKEARGGVMFIDEAHHFYQGEENHGSADFAKQAIGVIRTELESRTDTLYIFAGYTKEMNEFLDKADPGMRSRIPHVFSFNDYDPDTLLVILKSHLKTYTTTAEFDKMLSLAVKNIYNQRNPFVFGNAREMENVATEIVSQYQDVHNGEGTLDVDCIPDKYLASLREITPEMEEVLRRDLFNMIGLDSVKATLNQITQNAKGLRKKVSRGLVNNVKPENLTFLFMGNPGTGKTTVARMLGRILHGYGILPSDEVKVYSKENIVDKYVGGTMKNVTKMFNECFGRVMFIDEAYMLAQDEHGREALDQITANMTDVNYMGKVAVVMAGYTKNITDMLNSNPGLDSRFKHKVIFDDYSNEQLWQILENDIRREGLQIGTQECKPYADLFFDLERRKGPNFGNVRICNQLRDSILANQNVRTGNAVEISDEELMSVMPEDFPNFEETTAALTKSDDEILAELNTLVGLRKVKETIRGLINTIKVEKMRIDKGLQDDYSEKRLNFVFKGNPGTGKTTVARLLGNILANYGMISDPEVLTYKKADLVEGVVGASSKNVEKMFQTGVGKVIFIDEAYQLADHESKDALDAITNNMTDERYMNKMAMILAGYPGDMAQLIEGNPGLKSRFNFHIVFEDYSNEELWQIFCNKVRDARFTLSEECYPYAMAYFASVNTGKKDFGNARETVSLLETVKARQGNRIMGLMNSEANVQDMLSMFTPEDFPTFGKINPAKFQPQTGAKQTGMDKLNALIGIDGIREQFRSYIAMLRHLRENPQSEVKFLPHMAFLGNPGTGKTTVARIFGQILSEEGLLPNSNFVTVSASDLIAGYVGQSAIKARGQFERARGGVLFIDEAYQLLRKEQGGAGTFGEEVVTELIQFMDNDAESIVILAGYSNEILWLINNGNPGLKSRVPESNYFNFEDYSAETLYHIFIKKLSEYDLTEDLKQTSQKILTAMHANRPANWGNARVAEEFSSEVFRNYLTKHNGEGPIDVDCISDRYMAYAVVDAVRQMNSNQNGTSMQTQSSVPSENAITVDLSVNASSQHVSNVRQLEMATGLLKVHTSAGEGEGTGFIIQLENRYLLTCSHVIEGASSIIFSMRQGAFETKARVLWHDVRKDLALLQVDSLPDEVYFFELDSNIDSDPLKLTPLILCGYPDGTKFASGVSLIEGAINNYEKDRQWNDRQFDTIYANVSATHGCSGGPVVRKEDFVVVGLLQGGKEGGEIQFITDIHQLFRHINIKK